MLGRHERRWWPEDERIEDDEKEGCRNRVKREKKRRERKKRYLGCWDDRKVMTSILRLPRIKRRTVPRRSRLAPRSACFCLPVLTGLPTPALLSIIFTISFIRPPLGPRAVPIHENGRWPMADGRRPTRRPRMPDRSRQAKPSRRWLSDSDRVAAAPPYTYHDIRMELRHGQNSNFP